MSVAAVQFRGSWGERSRQPHVIAWSPPPTHLVVQSASFPQVSHPCHAACCCRRSPSRIVARELVQAAFVNSLREYPASPERQVRAQGMGCMLRCLAWLSRGCWLGSSASMNHLHASPGCCASCVGRQLQAVVAEPLPAPCIAPAALGCGATGAQEPAGAGQGGGGSAGAVRAGAAPPGGRGGSGRRGGEPGRQPAAAQEPAGAGQGGGGGAVRARAAPRCNHWQRGARPGEPQGAQEPPGAGQGGGSGGRRRGGGGAAGAAARHYHLRGSQPGRPEAAQEQVGGVLGCGCGRGMLRSCATSAAQGSVGASLCSMCSQGLPPLGATVLPAA